MGISYFLEVPRSIGVSNASILSLTTQVQATGASSGTQNVGSLKSDDAVKIKTDAQISGALNGMFQGLRDQEHRRSFALMKRIKELTSFVATVLASTGYQIGAGLSEVVHTAAYALRMGLIIVPAQISNGTTIPFAVRFTRLVSTNDEDTTMELQVHSVTGRKHDFSIKTGCKIYIFTCSGLFTATPTRDVAIKQLGPTSLRDGRQE